MEKRSTISISVIIPVFKVSRYIERCLKSVINQTCNQFECILVDDASPDDSIDKCERIIKDYDGPICFRIIHHEKNRGLSAARNTGTDAATGEYILYIDSDDYVSDDCVERLMAPVINDRSIEMVVGEHILVSDEGVILNQRNEWRQAEDVRTHKEVRDLYFDRKRHISPSAWNKLISKKFIADNHLSFKDGQLGEDTLWTFFAMKHLSHVYCIPDITYFYYRSRPDSISNETSLDVFLEQWYILLDTISRNFTIGEEDKEAALFTRRICRVYMQQNKSQRFRGLVRRYKKALSHGKHPKEKTLLKLVNILPHNKTGIKTIQLIDKR